ncbi:MAG: urease accessory protein UreH domain-containing protein [Gammaproteobacteria bacterium]
MDGNWGAVLTLAFGLGLMHALDADHIMAVSGLASARPGRRRALAFCARWAIGHGLTLLSIGAAVLLLGLAIPVRLSAYAESLVGVVLMLIGTWVLWDLWRRRVHLHYHTHVGQPPHLHWQTRSGTTPARHGHGAVLVGVMHGTAGSAPLLALIPIAQHVSPWFGLAYLLVFGIGVLTTMLLFGGLIGVLFDRLARHGQRLFSVTRGLVALSSIGFGVALLHG